MWCPPMINQPRFCARGNWRLPVVLEFSTPTDPAEALYLSIFGRPSASYWLATLNPINIWWNLFMRNRNPEQMFEDAGFVETAFHI